MVGLLLLGLATIAWFFPRVLTYPLIVLMVWISLALLYRAYKLKHPEPSASANPEAVEPSKAREL